MSTISDYYKNKFTLSDINNAFINPKVITDPPTIYTYNIPTVYEPQKINQDITITPVPQPPVVTYSKMRWASKTAMANPLRSFSVSGQNLSFTKTLMLPKRHTIMNNVPRSAVTNNCYTPVNNNVNITN